MEGNLSIVGGDCVAIDVVVVGSGVREVVRSTNLLSFLTGENDLREASSFKIWMKKKILEFIVCSSLYSYGLSMWIGVVS